MKLENIDSDMLAQAQVVLESFLNKDPKAIYDEIESILNLSDMLFLESVFVYEKLTWSENLLYSLLIESRDLLTKIGYYFDFQLNKDGNESNETNESDTDEL